MRGQVDGCNQGNPVGGAGSTTGGGSMWAAACFLFYVPDRIEYQLFLVTMLLGAVVSGLVTLAVYLPAYLAFVTPFVAATAILWQAHGTRPPRRIGATWRWPAP